MAGAAVRSFMLKGNFKGLPSVSRLLFSLNKMTNKCSDKAAIGEFIIKSHFHLALLPENHPSQMNKEIT